MKIKTLLLLNFVLIAVCAAIIGSTAYLATRQANTIAAQSTIAQELIGDIFELNSLAQDYVSYFENRPKQQWYLQYAKLDQNLSSPVLQQAPSRDHVAPLREEIKDIKRSFDDLVERSDEMAADDALEQQLSSELIVKNRRMIAGIQELAQETFAARAAARAGADRLVFVLLASIAALAALVALLLYRRIALPIARLQKGATIAGKGDLNHKIGGHSDDEIGQLAGAFDDMTTKLKQYYEGLEDMVQERTAALQTLSTRNRVMLDSIGDGLIAIDKEWNITLWNPAAESISGFTKAETLGQPLRKIVRFIKRSERTENVLFISDAMIDGKVHFMEDGTVMVRKDGNEIDVSDSAAPIIGADGKVSGAIIVFRDTSKEKEVERSKNDIVSLVTHELRGPATIIKGYAELLKEQVALPAEPRRFVQGIYDANERLVELANSLLTVFRVDFGEVVIDPEPVDLLMLADDALKQQELQATTRKIKMEKAYDEALPAVNADRRLVDLAFGNLLSNAVKYTPDGGSVRLEIRKREKELFIIVTDTGCGIPKEQRTKMFGKFFRASNVKKVNGVGVGLHVLKAMLERAGCRIGYESEENKGSTFFVAIPVSGMVKVGA